MRTCQVATKSEFTKRKNIISIIDEQSSSEVIFQFDDKLNTGEWFEAIRTRITALRQVSQNPFFFKLTCLEFNFTAESTSDIKYILANYSFGNSQRS